LRKNRAAARHNAPFAAPEYFQPRHVGSGYQCCPDDGIRKLPFGPEYAGEEWRVIALSDDGFSGQIEVIMENKKTQPVDWEALLNGIFRGKTVMEYAAERHIFRQGQPADCLFYLRRGKVKLSVISQQGKEAIVAILGAGEFFGEGGLAGQPLRMATAVAMTDCTIDKIERSLMARMLHERHDVSELFVKHLLSRNIRYEADLVDQLFNSSEKRLARILLLLSHFGKESRAEPVIPRVNQDTLAQMVGTTRSRISHFMNRFREHGFIDYDDAGLTVHSGLLNVVLHD
jgi:CRP/FNR family cyclic AMP-dependent transcriptional regulator